MKPLPFLWWLRSVVRYSCKPPLFSDEVTTTLEERYHIEHEKLPFSSGLSPLDALNPRFLHIPSNYSWIDQEYSLHSEMCMESLQIMTSVTSFRALGTLLASLRRLRKRSRKHSLLSTGIERFLRYREQVPEISRLVER